MNKHIDVNNVAYDYDVSSEFTWNYREIVEIKKRKRREVKYVSPTAKTITKMASAKAWWRAKQVGATRESKEVVPNYKMYKFNEDIYIKDPDAPLPGALGEILPGDPLYKAPITPDMVEKQLKQNDSNVNHGGRIPLDKTRSSNSHGRRVQKLSASKKVE